MAAIGTIRNKMGGLLIVVLVIAMVAFLMMDMGGGNGSAGQQQVNDVANVNGNRISLIEFNQRLDQNINNYKQQTQSTNLSDLERNNIRQSTYDELVTEKLNSEKYKNLGISISKEEYAAMLNEGIFQHPTIRSSFTDEAGNFNPSSLDQYLSSLDQDEPGQEPGAKRAAWQTFERYMINERLANKYDALIESGINIPEWMAEASYKADQSTVTFDYVYLPYRDMPDSSVAVSDSELTQYLNKNAKDFERDETVDIKYVTFPITASEADFNEAEAWITNKLEEWKNDYSDKDSSFIRLYSDVNFNKAYFRQDEVINIVSDSLFIIDSGEYLGPFKEGNSYTAYKLRDKKMIADSLKARHLLIDISAIGDFNKAVSLRDSLFDLVTNQGRELASLTPIYSNDEANKYDGGDLGWIMPNQMVVPFNNAIFFDMVEGDVKMVTTQFGFHLVEVYESTPESEAVQFSVLQRDVFPSDETQREIYSNASLFAGNNRTREAFDAAAALQNMKEANSVSKDNFTLQQLSGNSREIIKWAFENKVGAVSPPFSVGDNYVVAMVDDKSAAGVPALNDVRILVEAAVIKEKKGKLLAEKLKGSDLNAIASANGSTVANASGLSFSNPSITGVGKEAKVVGTAMALGANQTSAPIIGESGVFVVSTKSKTEAPASTDYSAIKASLKTTLSSSIRTRLAQADKEAADIEDNRFDIF